MFKTILAKAFSVIRRMNDFWDRDEDKEVSSIISGIVILAGILILKKPILFIIALVLIGNRVLHRFDMWSKWETSFGVDAHYDATYDDQEMVEVPETGAEDSVTPADESSETEEPVKEDEPKE